MPVEALQCPSCGAPLELDGSVTTAACVYCNVPLVVRRDARGHGELSADQEVDPALIEQLKGLLLAGQRDRAIAVFQAKTERDAAASTQAIDGYAHSVVQQSIARATLSANGVVILCVVLAATVGGTVLTVSGSLGLGLALVFFGGLPSVMLGRRLPRTVRYLSATVGEATILRHAYIGVMRSIHSYRLSLEVREPGGSSFRTELNMPVSESGRAKIYDGRRFLVKYFPGRPDSILFQAHVED